MSLAVLAGACAPGAPVPAAESGAFVVRLGPDTIAVERYTRTGDRLEGELVVRDNATATRRYQADLNRDGSVRRMRVELQTIGAAQPLAPYTFTEEMAGGTIVEVETRGGRADTSRVATPGTAIPELRHSLALREQAIRHALLSGRGGPARFYFFPLAQDSVVAVEVRPEAESVVLRSIDGEMRATVDRGGRILRWDGTRSTAKTTGERVGSVDVAALAAEFAARDRAGRGLGVLSPRDSVTLRVGGATLSVAYGRPSLRGRTAVGGVLVPWGQVWRMGANTPTHLRTDRELQVGGVRVPPGAYALYALPSPAGWTLIFNRRLGGSGRDYDPAQDIARIPVSTAPLAAPLEQLTVRMEPAGPAAGVVRVGWERTELVIPFSVR
ncbi:MAG TPA: DUF2911 domain-containing protein [Longimicrobium sp.]